MSSAAGLDKINFNIISHIPESIRALLVPSFNRFFQNGLPSSWKEFLVFFIPKSIPGKLRSISLASSNSWRDSSTPKRSNGSKNRDCSQHLNSVFINPDRAATIYLFSQRKFMLALSRMSILPVSFLIFPALLITSTLPSLLMIFAIQAYLGRTVNLSSTSLLPDLSTSKSQDTPTDHSTYKGVPQGCILSPLLYILYTRNFEHHLHPRSHCLQFADDVVIYQGPVPPQIPQPPYKTV